MTRPTLYIDHPATLRAQQRRGEFTGRLWCAMVGYSRVLGDGRLSALAPFRDDLDQMHAAYERLKAGQITPAQMRENEGWYAYRCLSKWAGEDLRPGALRCDLDDGDPFEGIGINPERVLRDGDAIFCECARPGSKSRTHVCHRELAPLRLVPAGWDCVLYGRRFTLAFGPGRLSAPNRFGHIVAVPGGVPYDPTAYGWPTVSP